VPRGERRCPSRRLRAASCASARLWSTFVVRSSHSCAPRPRQVIRSVNAASDLPRPVVTIGAQRTYRGNAGIGLY
jgi:hypothetical protein